MLSATNDRSGGAAPEALTGSGSRPGVFGRLGVVQELLAALDESTGAGRKHLMSRAIAVLRDDVLSPGLRLTPLRMAALIVLLGDLDRDVARAAPSTATFRDRARQIGDLLTAGGRPGLAP